MEVLTTLMGIFITVILVTIEAVIKITLFTICIPFCILDTLFYPITKGNKILRKIVKYAIQWRKGFYTARVYELWKIN